MNQPDGAPEPQSNPSGSRSLGKANDDPQPQVLEGAWPYDPEFAYLNFDRYTTARLDDACNKRICEEMLWNGGQSSDEVAPGITSNPSTEQSAAPFSDTSISWQTDESPRTVAQRSLPIYSACDPGSGQSSSLSVSTTPAEAAGLQLARGSSHQPTPSSCADNRVPIPRSHSVPATSPNQRFSCEKCPVTCSRESDLVRHMGTAHGIADVVYKCTHLSCDFFNSRSDKAEKHRIDTGHPWRIVRTSNAAGAQVTAE